MIEINLVPPQMRRRKRGRGLLGVGFNIPREVIIGLVGGLFVILLLISILLQTTIFMQFAERKALKKEWEEILPSKARVDAVLGQLRSLQSKVKSIENITGAEDIVWSAKLNDISDSVPRGVWIKSIIGNEQRLVIEGSSVRKVKDEMINVHDFAASLKAQKNFLKNINDLEVGSIQRRNIKNIEVADFSITANVITPGLPAATPKKTK